MNKRRLEAFSDGVLAIIITIMVLEMNYPEAEPSGYQTCEGTQKCLFVYDPPLNPSRGVLKVFLCTFFHQLFRPKGRGIKPLCN